MKLKTGGATPREHTGLACTAVFRKEGAKSADNCIHGGIAERNSINER